MNYNSSGLTVSGRGRRNGVSEPVMCSHGRLLSAGGCLESSCFCLDFRGVSV